MNAENTLSPSPPSPMVALRVVRTAGRLWLEVNAKGLHDILDQLGVNVGSDNRYLNRPSTTISVANSSFKLSTETMLVREYPAKFDLTAVYGTPMPMANILTLRDSGRDQCRKILEHYQPIDVRLEIHKKVCM